MEHIEVEFAKLHPDAIIPSRGTKMAVGFDLYALEDTLIVGGAGNVLVPTGVAVKLPPGTYGRIAMRSGLAVKQHLTVSAGVIDRDYAGPLGVVVSSTKLFDLKNMEQLVSKRCSGTFIEPVRATQCVFKDTLCTLDHGDTPTLSTKSVAHPIMAPHAYLIKKGERFAQLIVEQVYYAPGKEVESITREEPEHVGFGSTGKN